ncbi:sulfatase-like hydrolase/transferase [Croceivirga thetidis]|uniref:Sulfatase-like hydrolase/transferase n=1 Tax=Croceivirga thetidis TaxID=2721623 RepID=A0ABX1GQR6_9FLAO|nr:sulfatase-like hydrolase/transferase [Croceivirga thetidis]NKI32282.1 sulfatase-like hydrolase/transferase [Croceivirga thetidis]
MIVENKHSAKNGLGQYAKQIVAFQCCLLILVVFQHIHLYMDGLVDRVINQSLWLHFINQTGFTAVVGLGLLWPYQFLEGKKHNYGKRFVALVLISLLLTEQFLTLIYAETHIPFIYRSEFELEDLDISTGHWLLFMLGLVLLIYSFRLLSRKFNWVSSILKRMFPFTIVLFIMLFGMLFTTKKPINQNKFQLFVTDLVQEKIELNTYDGKKEYPFLKPAIADTSFVKNFNLKSGNPNFVIIMIQGLGKEFIGPQAQFKAFTPFLNELSKESLIWENHLSNALDTKGSITSLVASLPSLKDENEEVNQLNRNSLFGLLKERGYKTAYYYGGNNSLLQMDKFLYRDRVDLIVDKSKFDERYSLSPTNDNGIVEGYPDSELFRKWEETYIPSSKPKFELFLNLSTVSGGIPNSEKYISKVEHILDDRYFSNAAEWNIKRQKSFFASMLYTDESIRYFIEKRNQTKEHEETIYIITGTQNAPFLKSENDLQDYRIPLMIFGDAVKAPKVFSNTTAHTDIALSILSMIKEKAYPSSPSMITALGEGLCSKTEEKKIPLFRNSETAKEFIQGNDFYSSGNVYEIGEDMKLRNKSNGETKRKLKSSVKNFNAAHKYVLKENKVLPDSLMVFRKDKSSYSNEELVWISSVFNGKNFDKAYEKARDLAHNGNTERALLLSQYILDHVPNHVDAMILQGRIYAWNNKYNKAIEILKDAMANNPKYHDSYAAALDVCYWAKDKRLAAEIYEKMKENNVISIELDDKVQRCLKDQKILNEVTALKFELDEY